MSRQPGILLLALFFLGCRRLNLTFELVETRSDFSDHGFEPFDRRHCSTTAFFQSRQMSARIAGVARRFVALLPQFIQTGLCRLHLGFEDILPLFVCDELGAMARNRNLALTAFCYQALAFAFVGGEPVTDATHFAFKLLQSVA